jgi:hypothetical protein
MARKNAKRRTPAPTVLAMVLCDRITVDPATRKPTLHGCFRGLAASRFPVILPEMSVYVILANGQESLSITLRLIDVDETRWLFSFEAPVRFPDPLGTIEVTFGIRDVTFPVPGRYQLQLRAGDQLLMDQKLAVTQLPSGSTT